MSDVHRSMPTAYIVEDDEATRNGLAARARASGVVGVPVAVGSCAAILAALAKAPPDVLLVDLGLPDGNGLDVIRICAERYPAVLVMVLTAFADEHSVISAIRTGATGFLLKDDAAGDIDAHLRQLLTGGSPISPAITRHLIRHLRPAPKPGALPNADAAVHLSSREVEVLTLAHKGFTYGEIARLMGVTSHTVAGYVRRIYVKLAVHSRSEAVYEASKLGLIDGPQAP